jgi:hypothetical protein
MNLTAITKLFHDAAARREETARALDEAFDRYTRNIEIERVKRAAEHMKDADVAVLFAGEDDDRIPFFLDIYEELHRTRSEPLRIICTGGHTGFTTSEPSQASVMAARLENKGVARENITCEGHSRDTIANTIYTSTLLAPSERTVVAVTSGYHRDRVEKFLWRAIGTSRTVRAIGSAKKGSITDAIRETVVRTTVLHDTEHCVPGDREALNAYLREKHPFHAPYHGNIPSGAYTQVARINDRNFDATVERIIEKGKKQTG